MVALCAALAAQRLAQARPEAWSFRAVGRTPAPQEAEA